MPFVLPPYRKKISPATGSARSPSGSVAFCTRCSIARRTGNGILGGVGGSLDSPCPPPPPLPPMLDFDFDLVSAGGSHSGSLRDPSTTPYGWPGNAAFFPLTRNEKSSMLSLSLIHI